VYTASPLRQGRSLPRYQVDRSFNYVDSAYERPGPVMKGVSPAQLRPA
jgi:hypothetical protein